MKSFIATLVAGLAVGSASAQDRVAIEYTDIVTAEDASVLYQRIRTAANAVCPQEQVLGLYGYSASRRCVRDAVDKAVEDVGNPLLTAQHHGEAGPTLYSSRATRK